MKIKRKVSHVDTPPTQHGFLGNGHLARPVIQVPFEASDPFIVLMDDMLDKQDSIPVGGPHPHAGFETVTLLLEGSMGDAPHEMNAGDFEMMTAGSGIIHTEVISKKERFRLLQLWLNLPKKDRHAPPRIQRLSSPDVPERADKDAAVRVYSGTFGGLTSPIKNYTPVIIAEIRLANGAGIVETLPAHLNAFVYVIDGKVLIGEEERSVAHDQVAWLDRFDDTHESELILKAGERGTRLVLYAGVPQRHEIVSHGPFIADSMEEIRQLYADFRSGRMRHIAEIPAADQLAR